MPKSSAQKKQINKKQTKRTLQNRVNDLPWKDWLIFQKSFFNLGDDKSLYSSLIQFFTKRLAQKRRLSRVMVITTSKFQPAINAHGRKIFREIVVPSDFGHWNYGETDFTPFDFIVVDFRDNGHAVANQVRRSESDTQKFLANCRAMLKEGGFCVLISQETVTEGQRFPLPWVLSSIARRSFRLRDEKIGLQADAESAPIYVNVLQAIEEIGPTCVKLPTLRVGAPAVDMQWIKPKPKPRNKKEILHPAKFPEALVHSFVAKLTNEGDVILDPMGGTGSAAVAALGVGRKAIIIELGKAWAAIARARVAEAAGGIRAGWKVVRGDARKVARLIPNNFCPVRYTITSPPYWRILHNPGMHVANEGQKARQAKGLRTTYTESKADLGNITDYHDFIHDLGIIYEECASTMEVGGLLTIVTKNVKFERAQYPIAWDLVLRLCRHDGYFEYAGTTFWCQDDVGLKPFGMGCDWVSNILHNYCIHLRVRRKR